MKGTSKGHGQCLYLAYVIRMSIDMAIAVARSSLWSEVR